MGEAEIWQLVDASSVGGIERHVSELTTALCQAGLPARAVLYAPHAPNAWLDQLQREQTPNHVLSGSVAALVDALRRHRPRLVHTHGYKAGIVGRLAARLLGIPVVSSFHAGETGRWPVNVYQAVDAATAGLARRISVSQAIAERLPYKSETIANFVSVPSVDLSLPLPRRIAFVGRLSEEKGPDLFCEIARTAGPIATWDVYGDGPMREDLEVRYRGIVRFHGFQSDMTEVWKNVGLLMMPSRAEGLPMAALEALVRGIPVAASAVGGMPGLLKAIDRNGLFEAGDIARAVEVAKRWGDLDGPALATLRLAGRQSIQNRFSATAILPKVLAVYQLAGGASIASSKTIVQSSICSGMS